MGSMMHVFEDELKNTSKLKPYISIGLVKGCKTAPVLTLPGVGGVQCPVSHQQPLEAATLTNVPFPVDICLVTRPGHRAAARRDIIIHTSHYCYQDGCW